MTSKESLELLKQRIIRIEGKEKFNSRYRKYYRKIRKDLEIMDLLKKYKKYVLPNYETIKFWKMDEVAELYKIREWLEK